MSKTDLLLVKNMIFLTVFQEKTWVENISREIIIQFLPDMKMMWEEIKPKVIWKKRENYNWMILEYKPSSCFVVETESYYEDWLRLLFTLFIFCEQFGEVQ